MVESRTARMRLVQWSSGTDSPQRVDFNETFLNIETLAAIDMQGLLKDRPNASKPGMYYFATDQGTMYRSDGLAWAVVGSSVLTQLVRPVKTDDVAQTIQGLTSQTGDLQRIVSSTNTIYKRVRSNGDLIHGPLRVSSSARTTTASDTAPTHSATTVDNASTSMWGLSVLNSSSNTQGFYRAVRGGSQVFSVGPDGTVTTPAVVLSAAPTSDNHAVRKTDLDTKVSQNVYDINGSNISGILGVSKGGTGATSAAAARTNLAAAHTATTINAGTGLTGGGDLSASRTLNVQFWGANATNTGGGNGKLDVAARIDHSHDLAGPMITNVLPISKGGTNATTAAEALTSLGAAASDTTFTAGAGLSGGGTLGANRTFSVVYAGSGTANSAARSDHTHDINSSSVTGTLSVAGGGTGRTSINSGQYVIGAGTLGVTSKTPAQVLADIGAATSGHGHALTDANITGILPVSQGGTGATTVSSARSALGVPANTTAINTGNGLVGGGNLTASRTLSVSFAGSGSANTVARSDHKHAFSEILERLTAEQMPIATELTGGVDLDTITTDGDYTQTSSAEAASGTNYPTGIAGKLRVVTSSSGNMVWQKYTAYHPNDPKEYVRTRYGGTWGQWRQMADVNDIAALVNVYAAKDHGHSLTDTNITGTLPINQGGTGATTQAAARTALGVPSTSVAVNAGAGLSGGGTLAASRTLQVIFEGSGTKTTSARSDHGHALTDANITGVLPVSQGGTGLTSATLGSYVIGGGTGAFGLKTPQEVRSDIGASSANHGHSLTDNNIVGTLPVAQGGTGATTAAAARTALGVPSTSTSIYAGDGLTGGGSLSASRTLSVAFAGTGSANTSARSDHGHSLTDANITGTLPVAQGGTGAITAADALSNLGAMPRDIEVLPTSQNINTWTTSGVFIPKMASQVTTALGYPVNNAVVMLEHTQMASNYATQVITIPSGNQQYRRTNTNGTWSEWTLTARTPHRVTTGWATGWNVQTGGVSVVIHDDGTKGCSLEVTMVRTDPSFTQGSAFMSHGYFPVPEDLRPTHITGQYFWCMVVTAPGVGFINWSDGKFSCRTDTAGLSQTVNVGSRIAFNLTWVAP